MALRGRGMEGREAAGGQLKTAADHVSEERVYGCLREQFPSDHFLCEERFEQSGLEWTAPGAFWTIDALDGTRSFVEGYDGFCVQVAYVEGGRVMLGVVHEPVRGVSFWAVRGQGAYWQAGNSGTPGRLNIRRTTKWPPDPVFADSTRPGGDVGRFMAARNGRFLECGSIGLKIIRVAEGAAHVYAKALTFKLWDVAPGDLILEEAGGRLGLWDGSPIPYGGTRVRFENILAAPEALFQDAAGFLGRRAGG